MLSSVPCYDNVKLAQKSGQRCTAELKKLR